MLAPIAGLVQGSDGDFYGTTSAGGTGFGAIFKITSAGTLTTLYSFKGVAEGAGPEASLVQGSDGNFYGTTSQGGTNNAGTIFQLIPPCTYTLSTGLVMVAAIGDAGTFAINSRLSPRMPRIAPGRRPTVLIGLRSLQPIAGKATARFLIPWMRIPAPMSVPAR